MTLRIHRHTRLGALALSGALSVLAAHPAAAQNSVTSNNGRFAVELRDVSLADALQLVFKAAEVPSYQIDPAAQNVFIPISSFSNASFESVVLNLTRTKNFRVRRDTAGAYIIEPRVPVGEFQNISPNGQFPPTPFSTPVTPSPFGSPFGRTRRLTNPQVAPAFGNAGGGNEGKEYRIVLVRHVYVGGIARLFEDSILISTEDFVLPDSAGGGQGGQGGGRNGGQNGLGGIGGGGISGIGGNSGSGQGGFGGGIGGDIGGQGGGLGNTGDIGGGF